MVIVALSSAVPRESAAALDPAFSPRSLDALDPTRLARSLCTGRAAHDTLRARLVAAQAVAQDQAGLPIALDGGVPRTALPVSTGQERARRYVDQGVLLMYGFNHMGAIRSFRAAQAIDPDCALCFWGEALAYGPNINAPMAPEALAPALAALSRAQALKAKASPAEQGLIDALSTRYAADPAADRPTLDAAYANAMLRLAGQYPDNDDIAVLAAEAVVDTRPWDYWEGDARTPRPGIDKAIALVETVRSRNPVHAQAAHLYIHLMEASTGVKLAEPAADALAKAAPPTGHLLHMPAHIYYRLGRYADSMRVNQIAVRDDKRYLQTTGDTGIFRYGYYPHDVHFLVMSAQQAGNMTVAIEEARALAAILDSTTATEIGWIQLIHAAPYFAHAQFASPRKILALGKSPLPFVEAMRHFSRATAYAQTKDQQGFDTEIAAMQAIAAANDFKDLVAQAVPAPDMIRLAEAVAQGRMAFAKGDHAAAADRYRAALKIQKTLPYGEPPLWYYPVQQSLGAALYRQGLYADASQAFREAIADAPANGWALYGLAQSEAARGNKLEAAAARQALGKVWQGNPAWLRMDRL